MRERVLGLECEYALAFEPSRAGGRSPRTAYLYKLLSRSLRSRCAALPSHSGTKGHFFANGALLYFEPTDADRHEGLAELNTPECANARELTTHHLAQDALLREAIADVDAKLAERGYDGRFVVRKANVDREGHTFGTSESYLVDDPTPAWMWPLRVPVELVLYTLRGALIALGALAVLANVALGAAAFVTLGVALLPLSFLALLARGEAGFQRVMRRWEGLGAHLKAWLERGRPARWIELAITAGLLFVLWLYEHTLRQTTLRAMQRYLVPFLATRVIFSGNGHIDLTTRKRFFRLSSRGERMGAPFGVSVGGQDKPILDCKHLTTPAQAWPRRKRLVVLYADAHLAPYAQWLTSAVTTLVLEAIEEGAFAGAAEVRLRDVGRALREVNGDATLTARVALHNGETLTALAHQRRYLAIVRTHLDAQPAVDLQRFQVVQAWQRVLDALESQPDALFGELDWVTKRQVMWEATGGREGFEALGAYARSLFLLDRAALDDGDLEARPDEFWVRVSACMHPADRRALEEALGQLDRAQLQEMVRRAYVVRKIDFKYHELDPERGYAELLRREGVLREVSSPAEIERAKSTAPTSTRAYARGAAIQRAVDAGHRGEASWDRVVDRDGKEKTKLRDPLRP